METRVRLRMLASAAGLVATLGACGASVEVPSQPDAAESLDAFFDGRAGSLDEVVEQWNLAVQYDAGLCMRNEGFSYEPITVDVQLHYNEISGLSEKEWTKKLWLRNFIRGHTVR